ncbi:hypothetical protein Q4485_05530 [Granulosicoccaceae sp. 1_MG-2023]|nr:hypothetical protein [Granulosicoccaceae sp. 1_MG-2023]
MKAQTYVITEPLNATDTGGQAFPTTGQTIADLIAFQRDLIACDQFTVTAQDGKTLLPSTLPTTSEQPTELSAARLIALRLGIDTATVEAALAANA